MAFLLFFNFLPSDLLLERDFEVPIDFFLLFDLLAILFLDLWPCLREGILLVIFIFLANSSAYIVLLKQFQ